MEEGRRPFSAIQLIWGLLAGLGIGAVCLVLDFFIGFALVNTHYFLLGSLTTAALLIGIGLLAVRHSQDTGFLRGMLISLSLAFIACTVCGVAMFRPLNLH